MDLGIAGKGALVVGAGKDAGRALALLLAREGARVVLSGRRAEPLEAVAATIRAEGGEVHVLPADLTEPEGADRLAEAARAALGRIDLVGNTAGVFPTSRLGPGNPPPAFGVDAGWEEAFAWVLMPAVRLTRAILPGMIAEGAGAMVHLGANSARDYRAMTAQFGAMKAALAHAVKNWAREAGAAGVRVNAVQPGWIRGEGVMRGIEATASSHGRTLEDQERAQVESYRGHYWTPRMGRPEEYADAMAWLLSARASYVNGALLPVDGGSPAW